MIRSRLFTVVMFAGVSAAGGAWFTQCQPAARNVPVGPAHVSCPDRPAGVPSHQLPGTATALVPGRPVGLLACRFHGLNQSQPVGSFAAAATFAPAPIAAAFNVAKVPLPGVAYFCPAGFDEVIVLRFVYATGQILNVNLDPAGCTWATNGDRTVITPQSVLSTLAATLGRDGLPGQAPMPPTLIPPSGGVITP